MYFLFLSNSFNFPCYTTFDPVIIIFLSNVSKPSQPAVFDHQIDCLMQSLYQKQQTWVTVEASNLIVHHYSLLQRIYHQKQQTYQYLACHHVDTHYYKLQSLSVFQSTETPWNSLCGNNLHMHRPCMNR